MDTTTRTAENGPRLDELLAGSPYQGYVYAYPHKTAYRTFDRPIPLEELWAKEPGDATFLYVHVPFCEMRCGFCNLFTSVRPQDEVVGAYVDALERQARVVRDRVGPRLFARFAVGGGTPSYLDVRQLQRVFDLAEDVMGADLAAIPCSVEVSPETATDDKLALLAERGIDRVSMGVQSFLPAEVESVFRRQDHGRVDAALRAMGRLGFPVVNVDLMYGLPGQTPATFIASIDRAIDYGPAELYLYPLYVRPLTRMGSTDAEWDDERLACYRAGRDHLRALGWTQVSMRMFRAPSAPGLGGPVYRCQEDGMIGLGCGARTYTREIHHSSAYAVGPHKVKEIIQNYVATPDARFAEAAYGFELDAEDARRRWVILSLLSDEGLAFDAYRTRFGTDARDDLPELHALCAAQLAEDRGAALRLNDAGVERADAIGPWLFSARVRARMAAWESM